MMRRPIVPVVVCFGAGLATGLLRFSAPAMAYLVLAAVVVAGRRSWIGWLGAVALTGRLLGVALSHAEEEQCSARLPEARMEIAARVLEPVDSVGGMTRLAPRGAGCRGSTPARWPRARPVGAGSDVRVVGRWIRGEERGGRPTGRWHIEEVLDVHYRPRPDQALRNGIVQTISQLYGARGPIIDALVLNRKAELDRELRDRFARSGMIHLLAISGFHVGLVTAWMYAVFRLLRLTRGRSLALASLGAVSYAAFLGWHGAARRKGGRATPARLHLVVRSHPGNRTGDRGTVRRRCHGRHRGEPGGTSNRRGGRTRCPGESGACPICLPVGRTAREWHRTR